MTVRKMGKACPTSALIIPISHLPVNFLPQTFAAYITTMLTFASSYYAIDLI